MVGSLRNLYFAASVACMTAALFGYSVGFIGGVLVLPSFLKRFGLDTLNPEDLLNVQGTTVTVWLAGTVLGVLLATPIYTSFGRKRCLLFSALVYSLGAVLQTFATGGLAVFNIGRAINGVGVGAGTLVSPLYISEIATPATRSMLMSGYQVFLQLSALTGFWAAYVTNEIFDDASSLQYRVPVAIQMIPGLILSIGIFAIPEAPRFLAEHRDHLNLDTALAWLRGLQPDDDEVKAEAEELFEGAELDRRHRESDSMRFIQKILVISSLRRRLLIGIGLMIAQNMAGMNAINYYAPTVFRSAGFGSTSAMLFLTGLFGVIKLVAAVGYMFVFVRIRGNRFWLNLSCLVCALSMALLTVCIRQMQSTNPESVVDATGNLDLNGMIAILCVYIFAFAFSVGLGPISWNVCGEIFPPDLSAKCCTITTLTQWVFQIVIAGLTPKLIELTHEWTYVFYGSCCIVSFVWCWFAVPETKGVPLGSDMERLFEPDAPTLSSVPPSATERTPLLGPDSSHQRRPSMSLAV